MKLIILLFYVALVSCTPPKLEPKSKSVNLAVSANEPKSNRLKHLVLEKMDQAILNFNKDNCLGKLAAFQEALRGIDWAVYSNADLKGSSASTIQAMWEGRSRLHSKLGEVNRECALAMRDIFHIMRNTEDYLGEFAYDVPSLNPADLKFQEQPVPILDYKAYPKYFVSKSVDAENFKFKSGDLMIARGVSFISAIISQVSSNRSQFSHLVLVNVDEKTKKANTIESYIGVGVTRYKIEYALRNENARLLLLRPKNSKLGAKAAKILNEKAIEGNGQGGAIPYDYSMDFKNHDSPQFQERCRMS